ncbi:MAG: DNA-binding protein [Methermicoccaceae archaeon]
MDDTLDDIRKRRMAELEERMMSEQMAAAEQERANMELEAQKQLILRAILDSDARDRLNTLKLTRPELVGQIEAQLVAFASSGQLKDKITDAQLKEMLVRMARGKREFKIVRK